VALLLAAPVWAQQAQGGEAPQATMPVLQDEEPPEPPYDWTFSFGIGRSSGATVIGSVADEELGTITAFEIGSGTLFEARAARRVWWRLGGEAELGYASPGLDAIQSDSDGANRIRFQYAELDEIYASASLRLDLVDAWITPFLRSGVAVVHGSTDGGESSTKPAFLFGGGVEVGIRGPLYARADVTGLRSSTDPAALTGGVLEMGSVATHVLWTFGVGIRY
jgi:opacity protein-like surface antigen